MSVSQQIHLRTEDQCLWRFAGCEFDDLRFQLTVNGQVVDMERKPLELLRYLLSRPGEVVRKEELLEAVWPGVLVVDASLATAVSKLRKVLPEQEIIQTVPRVGYRIAVPVTRVDRAEVKLPAVDAPQEPHEIVSGAQARNRQPFLLRRPLLWSWRPHLRSLQAAGTLHLHQLQSAWRFSPSRMSREPGPSTISGPPCRTRLPTRWQRPGR